MSTLLLCQIPAGYPAVPIELAAASASYEDFLRGAFEHFERNSESQLVG